MPKTSRRTITKTSEEVRYEICMDFFNCNLTVKQICDKYRLANSTVRDIIKRCRTENDRIAYKPRGGVRRVKIKDEHSTFLRNIMDEEDEGNILTLDQLRDRLIQTFPGDFPNEKSLSLSAICNHINNHLEFTLKRAAPLEEAQLKETTMQKRLEYAVKLMPDGVNYLENCIFVDESGFNACMVPGRARSRKGKKAHILTKTKRAKNISIIGAISSRRVESLQAVMVNRGTNGEIFAKFMEELFKWLDDQYPGKKFFIIMDNASFHKVPLVKEKFKNTIHEHYLLPPYSPMFNPIETCFSKLKNYIKRSPRKCRKEMLDLIKESEKTVTRSDCEGWVKHCVNNITRCVRGEDVVHHN